MFVAGDSPLTPALLAAPAAMAVVHSGLGEPFLVEGQKSDTYLDSISFYATAADVSAAIASRCPGAGITSQDVVVFTNKVGRHHPGQSSGRAVAMFVDDAVRNDAVRACDGMYIVNRPAVSIP